TWIFVCIFRCLYYTGLILLKCRYSERKEIKEERLQKIAVSAMKQSLKTYMPEILPMIPFDKALQCISESQRFIAYCSDEFPKQLLSCEYVPNRDVAVMIGPEGDFSPEEVRQAIDCGFRPVTLGDTRLRTETAALYSCATIHIADEIKTE
ncbi:MAG: RNA methyltransferase, partial [Muribaculaceae bacterium]|nr:RNA methyltransferase [Muribaculaceae bacterium]